LAGLLAAVLCLGAAAPARAQITAPPPDATAFVLAAGGNLYVGNGTRVPGPVAANGTLLLDERVHATAAVARRDVKLRLLATLDGDLLTTTGTAQLANQARVRGGLVASRGVVIGIAARVDGGVVASAGGVRLVRLSSVGGDVYVDREFRGDRDVVVGAPGTSLRVRGDVTIRDRGEYFAAIDYEGTLSILGTGTPVLHAGVAAVGPGTLVPPEVPAWTLDGPSLPAVEPGTLDVTIAKADGLVALPPGRYRTVTLEQEGRMVLSPGLYEIDQLVAQSDARIRVEVAEASDRIDLRVRGDVRPGRRFRLDLGTDDATTARARAARVRTVAGGAFRGDQDVVWAGALHTRKSIGLGKHTTLVGSAWSQGDVSVGRDAVLTWVPFDPAA
jgi:hypothetical protein